MRRSIQTGHILDFNDFKYISDLVLIFNYFALSPSYSQKKLFMVFSCTSFTGADYVSAKITGSSKFWHTSRVDFLESPMESFIIIYRQ